MRKGDRVSTAGRTASAIAACRLLLVLLAVALSCASCATSRPPTTLADVYQQSASVPRGLLERPGKLVVEGTQFDWEEDLPSCRMMSPEKGQFTLHVLTRWSSSEYYECWLMLEFLKDPEYDSGRISSVLRVYGESRMPEEGLREKALRILHEDDYMEGLPMTSIDCTRDGRVCVSEAPYVADYLMYTNEATTAAAHQFVDLGTHDEWGALSWFRAGRRAYQDIQRNGHTLVFAEKVPIRGVLFGAIDGCSSSHGWQTELRLVNCGTLSREQMEAIEMTENVLPAELELWEKLRRREMRREEPPYWYPHLWKRVTNLPLSRWERARQERAAREKSQ